MASCKLIVVSEVSYDNQKKNEKIFFIPIKISYILEFVIFQELNLKIKTSNTLYKI